MVCLNEHWLHNATIFLLCEIRNFNLASSYCRHSSRGGGTFILVHSRFEFIVRRVTDTLLADDFIFEALCLEIPALNVVVLSLYRKPDYSYCAVFLRRLEILFNSLPKEIKSQSIYIAADFNLIQQKIVSLYIFMTTS